MKRWACALLLLAGLILLSWAILPEGMAFTLTLCAIVVVALVYDERTQA